LPTGSVKWFSLAKGCGFIAPYEGDKDVFVHISAVKKADYGRLIEGTRVSYELGPGRAGKISAENLRIES
jgi:CspA family cold shock protein